MPEDYSRLEDFGRLNQQRGTAQTDRAEEITQGKFRKPKACVFFMSISEHKHHSME